MKKTININGKDIVFKANANTTRLYRKLFNQDIFKDIKKLTPQAEQGEIDAEGLEVFQNLAYVMAKQGGNEMPEEIEEWLDQFEMFDIYVIMPQLVELWGTNELRLEEPKKKVE